MRTSLDSNILFDIFLPDPVFEQGSCEAVEQCSRDGGLVLSEPVYAELAAWFSSSSELDKVLDELGIVVEAVSREGAFAAGRAWKHYRQAGGQRTRIMTDFLIGGHALTQANQLLSRDRGFYQNYFSGLKVVDPSKIQ
jgi:predicted nucleic acid-binding protein